MNTIAAILLTICLNSGSQEQYSSGLSSSHTKAVISSLKDRKLSAGDLVPDGFMKVAEARGDLNRDGTDDLALIIRLKADDDAEPGEAPQAVLLFFRGQLRNLYFLEAWCSPFCGLQPCFF